MFPAIFSEFGMLRQFDSICFGQPELSPHCVWVAIIFIFVDKIKFELIVRARKMLDHFPFHWLLSKP